MTTVAPRDGTTAQDHFQAALDARPVYWWKLASYDELREGRYATAIIPNLYDAWGRPLAAAAHIIRLLEHDTSASGLSVRGEADYAVIRDNYPGTAHGDHSAKLPLSSEPAIYNGFPFYDERGSIVVKTRRVEVKGASPNRDRTNLVLEVGPLLRSYVRWQRCGDDPWIAYVPRCPTDGPIRVIPIADLMAWITARFASRTMVTITDRDGNPIEVPFAVLYRRDSPTIDNVRALLHINAIPWPSPEPIRFCDHSDPFLKVPLTTVETWLPLDAIFGPPLGPDDHWPGQPLLPSAASSSFAATPPQSFAAAAHRLLTPEQIQELRSLL